ncbi:hypothetical protein LWI29_013108 [Acer saccharum]|uniref:Secreted protein n=1 Tax=Acer saccharum TaxID=4024 RepID=A0AA39RPQ4_ACESA|nr:hypothetical protein LWI29_013108 [Acer saccharum]
MATRAHFLILKLVWADWFGLLRYNSPLITSRTVVDKSLLSSRSRLPPSIPHRLSLIFVSFNSNSSWVFRSVLQQQDWFSDS